MKRSSFAIVIGNLMLWGGTYAVKNDWYTFAEYTMIQFRLELALVVIAILLYLILREFEEYQEED